MELELTLCYNRTFLRILWLMISESNTGRGYLRNSPIPVTSPSPSPRHPRPCREGDVLVFLPYTPFTTGL